MLRLLLLRGFGLLTGGIGLTLGLGDPGLAVERLRLRIDPGRSVPEPRSPDRKRHHRTNHHHHCRKPRTRRLRTDRRIAIQSGARPWLCPYARRRWQACSSRHRPWIERRRVHRYRWFRRWLGSRKRCARGRAAGQGAQIGRVTSVYFIEYGIIAAESWLWPSAYCLEP